MIQTHGPLVYVDPVLQYGLRHFVIAVCDGEMEPRGAQVLHALDLVDGGAGETLDEDAGDASVDQSVADDQDVK